MSRAVAPVRLSNAEREQIASAALRQGIIFSGFLRQAGLEASARVEGKVSPVKAPERETREQAKATILEPEPAPAVEEPWRPHHFVDGGCLGCGLDVDDVRGRDFPCEPAPGSICSAGALTRLDRVEAARAPPRSPSHHHSSRAEAVVAAKATPYKAAASREVSKTKYIAAANTAAPMNRGMR